MIVRFEVLAILIFVFLASCSGDLKVRFIDNKQLGSRTFVELDLDSEVSDSTSPPALTISSEYQGTLSIKLINTITESIEGSWTGVDPKHTFTPTISSDLASGDLYKYEISSSVGELLQTSYFMVKYLHHPYLDTLAGTSALADLNLVAQDIDTLTFNESNPLKGRNVNISGDLTWASGTPSAIYIQASNLTFTSAPSINVNGKNGVNGNQAALTSGKGGEGGNSGAGGSHPWGGRPGTGGQFGADGYMTSAGVAAKSWSSTYLSNIFYGNGGKGGDRFGYGLSLGGSGQNGAGGGGSSGTTNRYTSGGGGGGGLIVIVAEDISGSSTLSSQGGVNGSGQYGRGSGGSGVIWVAAKNYDGNISINIGAKAFSNGYSDGDGGTARIFQILENNRLLERNFNETW